MIILWMVFAWVMGLLGFFILPVLSSVTQTVKWPAKFAGGMAMRVIGRAAMVVSEHDEIVFKRMDYKDTGVERIVFGAEKKDFDDPWAALSHWKGFPFALADEVTGTLFDPRHAAFGSAFRDEVQAGNVDKKADPDGQSNFDVTSWGPGIVELPGKYDLVDLSGVRALVDGGERAEFPQRIENLYEFTREPFESDRPSLRIFLPIGAMLACVFTMWFLASQTGGSGDGGGGGTTVGFGSIAAAGLAAVTLDDAKRALAPVASAVVGLVLFFLLLVFFGPIWGFLIAFSFSMGFTFIPFISMATMWVGPISGAFGDLFLRMFLMGFTRPVWVWSPTGYEVVEASTLDEADDVHWYRLKGQLIGFTYEPDESSFGPEWTDPSKVEAMQGVEDGTAPAVPTGWLPSEQLTTPPYGAMVPKKVDADSIYVDVRTIVRRIADAATGDKTLQRLLLAKEKHGSDNRSMGDQALLVWTVGCALFGLCFGWVVFF